MQNWITVSTVYWVWEMETVETVRYIVVDAGLTRLKPGENEIREFTLITNPRVSQEALD